MAAADSGTARAGGGDLQIQATALQVIGFSKLAVSPS